MYFKITLQYFNIPIFWNDIPFRILSYKNTHRIFMYIQHTKYVNKHTEYLHILSYVYLGKNMEFVVDFIDNNWICFFDTFYKTFFHLNWGFPMIFPLPKGKKILTQVQGHNFFLMALEISFLHTKGWGNAITVRNKEISPCNFSIYPLKIKKSNGNDNFYIVFFIAQFL